MRRAIEVPNWLHSSFPSDEVLLRIRIREGLIFVCERRNYKCLVIGLRLLSDIQGFLNYATGRPGYVSAHAAALWNMWQPEERDDVLMDLLDTCWRLLDPPQAEDYWADFLATLRGAATT